MNIVFDRKTLKVVSLLDNEAEWGNSQDVLKSMFPRDFQNLGHWFVKKKISNVPIGLSIKLDEEGHPTTLLYRGKEVYRISEQEKNKQNLLNHKKSLELDGIFLGKELSDFLIKSPYTKTKTSIDLQNGIIPFQDPISIIWRGFFKLSTGYSSIGRNILFRLHNYGIFASPEYLPSHSDIDPIYLNYLSKYDSIKTVRHRKNKKRENIKVLSHTPLLDDFVGRKIIFTMMETETLHPDFVNICNRYNEVWVPCKHNRNLFVNHGVKVPVHVIPLGVDERFYFGNSSENINMADNLLPLLGSGLKKFKFISLFQWYVRKRPDILIKSFVKSFTDKDDVSLIVVNHYGDPAQLFGEVQNYAKSVRNSNWPSIFLYNQIPYDAQLPSIYKFCNAFVSTSMGEGFSLPHIEAAACGLPVISSYHTAMKDYLNNENAYLVTPSKTEICSSSLASACGWYNGQVFNSLGDDEVDQFSTNMKMVVENYDRATQKAIKLQNLVRNNYTWDITTGMVARRIREKQ